MKYGSATVNSKSPDPFLKLFTCHSWTPQPTHAKWKRAWRFRLSMDNRRTPTPVYSPTSPRPYSPPPDAMNDCEELRDAIRHLHVQLNNSRQRNHFLRQENDELKHCRYENKELLELVKHLQEEQINNTLHVARVKRARDGR